MKDCAGVIIEIGQTVATNVDGYTASLTLCKVVGFTPKKVKISYADRYLTETTKFPEQLAVVGRNEN